MLAKQKIFLILFLLIIYSSAQANKFVTDESNNLILNSEKEFKNKLQQNSVLITEHPIYGKILTDNEGYALYFFTYDPFGQSTCDDEFGCDVIWPIFYADTLIIGDGLNPDDFGTIMRDDGNMQITYKGWPLYYYLGDNAPGVVNGEDVDHAWYVAKPDYTIMLINNQLIGHDGIEYNSNYEPGQEIVQYFVDAFGNTLYTFSMDNFNKNNFTLPDFSNNNIWIIFEEELNAVPSVINKLLFDTINVFGHTQLTYKGWPLYYFGQDSMIRGNNKGVSFPQPGIWPIARADLDSAIVVGIEEDLSTSLPTEYNLSQNYPNPFNPSTNIKFSIPQPGLTSIKIYNSIGQIVDELLNEELQAGNYSIQWDASNFTSGVYYYSITSNNFYQVRKMILLK